MNATRAFPLLIASILLGPGLHGCDLEDGTLTRHGPVSAAAAGDAADDDTPAYEGEIDLAFADVQLDCYVDAPEGDPEGLGTWEFTIFFEGWATEMWIEMADVGADYCEGWDDVTGEPCEMDGETRPGWEMLQDDYGWDTASGFWDQWLLDLDYHSDIWPPEADASWLPCEVDTDLLVDLCGCDYATSECYCTQYAEYEYAGGDDDSAADDFLDACECRVEGQTGAAGLAALTLLGLVFAHRRR